MKQVYRMAQSSLQSLHQSMGICEKEAIVLSMAKLNNNVNFMYTRGLCLFYVVFICAMCHMTLTVRMTIPFPVLMSCI